MEEQAKWFGPLEQPILLALVSASYCYFFLKRIPPGTPRLVPLIPVLYLFSVFPWRFSSPVRRALSSFFVTWLTSFKLLLFCFGRGPLLQHRSFPDFALISFLPLKIRKQQGDEADESPTPTFVSRYELVPISNQPYFATSLRDFWGKRWNRMSSDLLRQTVYDPIRAILSGPVGPRGAKLSATAVTLVVSGLLHEMVMYYITCGRKPTWEVAWFFVLHGACMVLETVIKVRCRANGWAPLNPVVSGVLTVCFTTVTCYWMLVLPVWKNSARECRFR